MALLDFSGADTPTDPSWLQTMLPSAQGAPLSPAAPAGDPSLMERMLNAIRHVESGGDPNKVSPAGAVGPYQIMPKTAADPGYGVQPLAPDQLNQEGPARRFAGDYLKALYSKLGSWPAAFAAYNGGMKQGLNFNAGAPMPDETTNYVPAVQDAMAKGLGAPTQDAGSQPAPMSLGTDQSTPYDAATDGPGGATPPAAPAASAGGIVDTLSPQAAPPVNSPVPQNVGTDGGTGAGMPQVSNTPLPSPAAAPAPQQASAAGAMPPSMQEYMRSMSNGGDTTMGRIGDALMAIGAGLPGNGMRGASQSLLQMSQLRKERMLDAQQKMYPQMMAYKSLVSQGVDPNTAMIRVFAPAAAGEWKEYNAGTDMNGNPITRFYNPVTGEEKSGPGSSTSAGMAGVPDTLMGPDRLKKINQVAPAEGSMLNMILDGEIDPTKDLRFMRNPAMMTAWLRQADYASRDPNHPDQPGDYDPIAMAAARKQYAELSDPKSTSAGGVLRGFDQGAMHFGQAVQAYDKVNQGKFAPLDSGSWGPATSLFNKGILDWSKLNADPDAQAKLPPVAAAAYEMAKAFRGNGSMSDSAAADFMANFRLNMSPQEQQSAFTSMAKLMQGAHESYYNKYQQTPASFRARHPFPVQFSPESLSLFKRFNVRPSGVDDETWKNTQPLNGIGGAPKIQIQPGEKVAKGPNGPNDQLVLRDGKLVHVMTGEPVQ